MAREGRIGVRGGEVWYRMEGGGDATPLLLLHGGPGAGSATFEPLFALADERPVIAYDQLGAGRSDRPEDDSLWRLERFVEEIDAVRRGLGLDRIHLLGHSWGGFLALEYALGRPAGLASLCLCSAAAGTPEFEREVRRLVGELPAEVRATLARHEAAGTTHEAEYFAAVMRFMQRHICRLDPWPEMLLEFDPMESAPYRVMWGENEFTITGNLRTWDRGARLGEVRVPALVTCGRHDEATPACARTLARGIPGARLHVFERSAHMTFLEQPEEFVRVVREFLRAVDRSGL